MFAVRRRSCQRRTGPVFAPTRPVDPALSCAEMRARSPLGGCFTAALLSALSACGPTSTFDGDAGPPTSGSSCPDGGTSLTWDTFGQDFFATWCTRCHNSAFAGAMRNGAPDGLNWDV